MRAEMLLENFGALVGVPGGVEKLRQLILQLAVRGHLSKPIDTDQPISNLLMEIESAKFSRQQSGHSSKSKADAKPKNSPPFALPSHWVWRTLGEICSYIQRGKGPIYNDAGPVRIVSQKCVQWRGFNAEACRGLDQEAFAKYSTERLLVAGDLLWNSTGTGTIGRINVFPDLGDETKFVADSHVTVLRLAGVDSRYIWCHLASPSVQATLEGDASGSTNQVELSSAYVRETWIPLPPLSEQRRIVAKVDELMALCDRLEAQQANVIAIKQAAGASTLNSLVTKFSLKNSPEFWTRFADEFSSLIYDKVTIQALRSAILTLAISGRLLAQDDADEPASLFVERIEKGLGEGRKKTAMAQLNEHPFQIPKSWTWSTFTRLGVFGRGRSRNRPRNDPALYAGGTYPLVQTGDVARANGTIHAWSTMYNDLGLEQSKMWPKGTLCITIAANIADTAILGFDACFPDSVVGFVPDQEIGDARYFEYFMRTAKADLLAFAPSTAQKNINLGILEQVLIPIPPLAEQKRIVARVDDLMGLCDRLQNEVDRDNELSLSLLASIINELTDPDPKGLVSQSDRPSKIETTPQSVSAAKSKPSPMLHSNTSTLSTAAPVDTKFQEAALVGAIVTSFFADGGEPIGNFRLQKAVYFARRHNADPSATADFLKKAAGPYNPSMKYSGGIAIAKAKNYITEARGRYGFGHIPGATIAELDPAVERYGYGESAAWVNQHFKFKKNEEWELLATVDYAMLQLRDATSADIFTYVANDPEWRPKIEKLSLTEFKIESAMLEIRALFPNGSGAT